MVVAALVALLAGLVTVLRRRRPKPVDRRQPDLFVPADDGVPLAVEEDGNPNAALTVVFVHGFTAQLAEFDLQREALRDRARIVLYDQRGHGRSGWGDTRNATIDQTGRDLAAVLEARVPTGPVVLVGHSLGGMTVMALADQRPELFGPRIVGVCLLATSAGQVVESALGSLGSALLLRTGLFRVYLWWLRLWAPLLERFRVRGSRLAYLFTRHYLFGTTDATRPLVREVQAMLEETPVPIVAAFYPGVRRARQARGAGGDACHPGPRRRGVRRSADARAPQRGDRARARAGRGAPRRPRSRALGELHLSGPDQRRADPAVGPGRVTAGRSLRLPQDSTMYWSCSAKNAAHSSLEDSFFSPDAILASSAK